MSDQTIEDRLTAMERAVRELADRLETLQGKSNWLQRFYGAFDDMPESEFEEFVRVGREFRNADRPSDDEQAP
jgi:hypothetical protein